MLDVIDDLVEKMDDKNLQNFYGDTPLHVATFNNQIDVVKKLKQCRSNENEGSQSSTEFCCDMKCNLF